MQFCLSFPRFTLYWSIYIYSWISLNFLFLCGFLLLHFSNNLLLFLFYFHILLYCLNIFFYFYFNAFQIDSNLFCFTFQLTFYIPMRIRFVLPPQFLILFFFVVYCSIQKKIMQIIFFQLVEVVGVAVGVLYLCISICIFFYFFFCIFICFLFNI